MYMERSYFKIKFIGRKNVRKYGFKGYACSANINDLKWRNENLLENLVKFHRRPESTRLTRYEQENILVASKELEPLIFYQDGPHIKCKETNKILSCFCVKWECCGSSLLFLHKESNYNIKFNQPCIQYYDGNIELPFLTYSKSPIYPGWGHKAGHIVLAGAGNATPLDERSPIGAYHDVKDEDPELVELEYL